MMKAFTAENAKKEIKKVMKYQLSVNETYNQILEENLENNLFNVHRFYRICGYSKTNALIKAFEDYKMNKSEFIEIGNMEDLPICF